MVLQAFVSAKGLRFGQSFIKMKEKLYPGRGEIFPSPK